MGIVIGLIWVVVFLLAIYELVNIVKSLCASKWKITIGKLTEWNFGIEADAQDTVIDIKSLEYTYDIDGIEYTSNFIGYGFPAWMSVLYIKKSLDRILENALSLNVYYNPADPKISVLTVGLGAYHLVKVYAYLLVLLVFGVFGMSL